ncbi:integrase [Cupriavidus basilensis]
MWDGKKKFRLGKTLPEAYRVWADRIQHQVDIKTVGQLLERYAMEVVPEKAATTQQHNALAIRKLTAVFGKRSIASITPQVVYRYIDQRSVKKQVTDDGGKTRTVGGRIAAHREVEVLSAALTKAVRWGYIDRHPFKGEIELEAEKPRDRYVQDWEIAECMTLQSKRKKGSVRAVQAYIRIKMLTGMARSGMLRLRPAVDFQDDGIHIQRHKTAGSSGKRTIYEWTAELRAAVADALTSRPVDISPWLFCTLKGECYIDEETGRAGGFDSMWRGFMDRLLAETKVNEKFTEHDIRAKVSSDADTVEHARALLSHATTQTTQRTYRRKAERVKPLR